MLAVASTDADRARVALQEFYDRGLTEEQKQAADIVMDFDADELTCPACLATFLNTPPNGPDRCPDCGLNLAI